MSDITLTYYGSVQQDGALKLPGAKIRKEVAHFADQPAEDDPYKDFPIPDDLMW